MADYSDKTVLITGGTGSFGRTMTDFLLTRDIRELRILSRDEEKQDAMRNEIDDARLRYIIGDVRDRATIDGVMRGVDHVFHAAALKQVPSCDFFPIEAVRTNVMGSANVIHSAVEHGVRSIVCLSTDKAVLPINAMGMTKALMEKVAHAVARELDSGDTVVSSVRYGNVMCSRGSVIPLFMRQIRERRPLTITEPSMTRFLMPLRDAVGLVDYALTNARQGDLFIQKAPASTIGDLLQALVGLFEAEDLPVRTIGVRHGEKLYETLATAAELRHADDLGEYFRVPLDARDLNYGMYFVEGDTDVKEVEDFHSHNATRLSVEEIQTLLLSLPEVTSELDGAGIAH